MKQKLVAFLTATAMILSLTACGNAENSNSDDRVKELEKQIAELEAEKEAIQQPGGSRTLRKNSRQPIVKRNGC